MDGETYRIIITGELADGFGADEVVERLASLFKQPSDSIAKQFGQQPIPLTSPYSAAKAEKVSRLLQEIGVLTRIEPFAPESPLPSTVADVPPGPKEHNVLEASMRRARIITYAVLLLLMLLVAYILIEKPFGEIVPVLSKKAGVEAVVPSKPVKVAKKRAVFAKGSMPQAVVTTPQGTATFLNMNILSTGIKLAAMDPSMTLEPGTDSEALITLFELPEQALQDGWGKRMWVSIGDGGIIIASAGPDGKLETEDDLVMYREIH